MLKTFEQWGNGMKKVVFFSEKQQKVNMDFGNFNVWVFVLLRTLEFPNLNLKIFPEK